jgi:hypothetical protein
LDQNRLGIFWFPSHTRATCLTKNKYPRVESSFWNQVSPQASFLLDVAGSLRRLKD